MSVGGAGLAFAHWSYLPQGHLRLRITVHAVELRGRWKRGLVWDGTTSGLWVLMSSFSMLGVNVLTKQARRRKKPTSLTERNPIPSCCTPLGACCGGAEDRDEPGPSVYWYLDLRCFGQPWASFRFARTNDASPLRIHLFVVRHM